MPASVSTSAATKAELAAPRRDGVELGHFGQAEIVVDDVEPGEQSAVALGRSHGRIAALVEHQLRAGIGQMLRDDGLHPRAHPLVLFPGQLLKSPRAIAVSETILVLPDAVTLKPAASSAAGCRQP